MRSVSRMGFCGSLFVVRHSLCQLVSFFFNAEFFFFGPCLFERLVTNFSFDLSLGKLKFESTRFLCLMIFFQRLVTNSSFEPSLLEGLNLNP